MKRLSMIGNFSKGFGISKKDITERGLPAILYGHIYTEYNFTIENISHYIDSSKSKNAKLLLDKAILSTGSGEDRKDIGKTVLYQNNEKVFIGGDIIVFKQNKFDNLFITYALNSRGAKNEKAKKSKGEIIIHIYASKLKNIYIPIPPLNEQKKYQTILLIC